VIKKTGLIDDRNKRFYDPENHQPEFQREIANQLLDRSWKQVNQELDRMSRYEAGLRSRYDEALKQFLELRAAPPPPAAPVRHSLPEPEPVPIPPASETSPAPISAAHTRAEKPALQNEPNFDIIPDKSTQISHNPSSGNLGKAINSSYEIG
jgi:hypothetical protein